MLDAIRRGAMTVLVLWVIGPLSSAAGVLDDYVYKLEDGLGTKACEHMSHVYNNHFRRPWDLAEFPRRTPPFPRLPGIEYDELMATQLVHSAFPSSPEFDRVPWKEGRIIHGKQKGRISPMLVAELDLDNDGKKEILIKASFMLGYAPGGGSSPGGLDRIFVLDEESAGLSRELTLNDLYGQPGTKRPASLDGRTLGIQLRSIRPFVYDGTTYLSVYEQIVPDRTKGRIVEERMWVLRYKKGGENLGGGNWNPVQADRVCRFRMVVSKQSK